MNCIIHPNKSLSEYTLIDLVLEVRLRTSDLMRFLEEKRFRTFEEIQAQRTFLGEAEQALQEAASNAHLALEAYKAKEASDAAEVLLTESTNVGVSLADYYVQGDKAKFRIGDIIENVDEYGFSLSEAVGWGSLVKVAGLIMTHITKRFGVRSGGWEESSGREGGLFQNFKHGPSEERLNEFQVFLEGPADSQEA
jgi:hypothetical protein